MSQFLRHFFIDIGYIFSHLNCHSLYQYSLAFFVLLIFVKNQIK